MQVLLGNRKIKIYCKYLGNKGDWPWLRAAHKLKTGYNCKRICHLCEASDVRMQLSTYCYNFPTTAFDTTPTIHLPKYGVGQLFISSSNMMYVGWGLALIAFFNLAQPKQLRIGMFWAPKVAYGL